VAEGRKIYLAGTHRVALPADTVRRVGGLLAPMGITRLANVTGLDVIGVPVAQAIRPNSRSISVSQGKGVDLDAAMASAVMEAIEGYHAERVALPLLIGSWAELRFRHRIADVDGIPRAPPSSFHAHASILWVEGINLQDGEPMLVPYETVHTDFTVADSPGGGCFAMTSNGLASGNHVLEATSHAICEVIERDAHTLWFLADAAPSTRIESTSIDDPTCRELMDRYDAAGIDVCVWDATSDIGIATFVVAISDRHDSELRPSYPAHGVGCHPSRGIALARALTEAAQSRLTLIAGSRDDRTPIEYAYALSTPVRRAVVRSLTEPASKHFAEVPTYDHPTLDLDVALELDLLRRAGLDEVVAVDLSRPEFGIPVVRVVIPHMEVAAIVPGAQYGRRARHVLEAGAR
jgi:ribosomal protein S12 methylthiotransferase accessory factor